MTRASVYNWLRQERIDRARSPARAPTLALDLAAARRRIRQLETELAVARKVNEVLLERVGHEFRVATSLPPGQIGGLAALTK